MTKEKYALLDTDFISKMHLIKKDDNSPLIEKIMEMPNYLFYCHEQIRTELKKEDSAEAVAWLENQISSSRVICLDDEKILKELEEIYGPSACAIYANLLKTACEAYRAGYFRDNFPRIEALDYSNVSRTMFLKMLNEDEIDMGIGNNLGEIKTYVLLQMLQVKCAAPIYVFCSDDRNARSGIISIGNVMCISVLSSFVRLQEEINFQKADAEPYLQSFLNFCNENNQRNFRVQDNSKGKRMCRVPCQRVLDEIYEGKFAELKTGILRYKEW